MMGDSMGEPSVSVPTAEKPSGERLDSWKEIAVYLNRDVTTVQRWEKREAMPVHRHLHDKRGSVYAVPSELDTWLHSRRLVVEQCEKQTEVPPVSQANLEQGANPRRFRWLALGGIVAALALLGVMAYIATRNFPRDSAHPRIQSLAVLPLKNLSGDPSQDYLADGMTDAVIGRFPATPAL